MMISNEDFFPILRLCFYFDVFNDLNMINEAPEYIKREIEGEQCMCEVESYKKDAHPAKGNEYEIIVKVMEIL